MPYNSMEITIENPIELVLELTYINGMLNEKEVPDCMNLTKLNKDIRDKL